MISSWVPPSNSFRTERSQNAASIQAEKQARSKRSTKCLPASSQEAATFATFSSPNFASCFSTWLKRTIS